MNISGGVSSIVVGLFVPEGGPKKYPRIIN